MSAITEKQGDNNPPSPWGPSVETAPSVLREDEPSLARTLGVIGACLVIFGGVALTLNLVGGTSRVNTGWALLCVVTGVVGLLSHAAFDRDLQIRRMYWAVGLVLNAAGPILCLYPIHDVVGGGFAYGYLCLILALLFLIACIRHETDQAIRNLTLNVLAADGGVMVLVFVLFSNNFTGEFMIPAGALLGVLGLAYLCAYVSNQQDRPDLADLAGLGLGLGGGLALLIGLGRSALPPLLHSWGVLKSEPAAFLMPHGLLYMGIGFLYLMFSLGQRSDLPLVVLTRRELSSFFFSPIAYLVLVGQTLIGGLFFILFVQKLTSEREIVFEPIIQDYLLSIWTVIWTIFIVPLLTMRLFSEEHRTGTIEVLLTAPVKESSVVLSKFFAALFLFLLMWAPYGLYLLALRVGGGEPFDARALFSFFVVLAFTGAHFVSMGLLFSSLTRNQIASAVMTGAGMMVLFADYFLRYLVPERSIWAGIFLHMSFVHAWFDAFKGLIVPRMLLYHLSCAIVFVFATIRVLEARRWK